MLHLSTQDNIILHFWEL